MQPGSTLGHFRLEAPIGAGGMGEVYRATDARLGREVAIKILPETFAADPARLARFEREARSLAALNHRGIASIYEVGAAAPEPPATGEEAGPPAETSAAICHFLVMELVAGETLAHRIARGALPIGEVVPIARQIAEALEAAHAKGIVHRDLKPGNVMVTPDGQVKVLDFGLAKALAPEAGAQDAGLTHSPTLTLQATLAGVLLGTAAYMSPEQARGGAADARSDLWAFGCVVWEMLTGRRPFGGETVSDTLAEVLKVEPSWDELPEATPPALRQLLERCLVKSPKDRLHAAADARIVLAELELEQSSAGVRGRQAVRSPGRRPGLVIAAAAAGLLVGALVTLAVVHRTAAPPPAERVSGHFSLLTASDAPVRFAFDGPLALSPDGSILVYSGADPARPGENQLYLRQRDDFVAHPIAGTLDATGPFFSADGEWVGFFDQLTLKLEKVSIHGGAPIALADVSAQPRGGSWGRDGTIVFVRQWLSGLESISADGGPVTRLTQPDTAAGIKTHRYPFWVPGTDTVLYTEGTSQILSFDDARIMALSLSTGKSELLVQGGSAATVLDPGILVYARSGALLAAPLDTGERKLRASPVPVLEGIVTSDAVGMPTYAFSRSGDLAYIPGGPEDFYTRLVEVAMDGTVTPLPLEPRLYRLARISPDGSQLAINMEGGIATLWRYDLDRGTLVRLTHAWDTNNPMWSPDGSRLAEARGRGGTVYLEILAADGSGTPQELTSTAELGARNIWPTSWSPDGRRLAFSTLATGTGTDIWIQSLDPPGEPQPFLRTPFNELEAVFSPDGRWLAYSSDESGRDEVFLRPIEGSGGAVPVSAAGGFAPQWSPDGGRLYFRNGRAMMAVDVGWSPRLTLGRPQRLFDLAEAGSGDTRVFDLAPDGTHFVTVAPGGSARPLDEIRVILGWGDEVRAKLAGQGRQHTAQVP